MKEILICSLLVLGIVADEVIFEVPNFKVYFGVFYF